MAQGRKQRAKRVPRTSMISMRAKSETVEVETLPSTYPACCDSHYFTHLPVHTHFHLVRPFILPLMTTFS